MPFLYISLQNYTVLIQILHVIITISPDKKVIIACVVVHPSNPNCDLGSNFLCVFKKNAQSIEHFKIKPFRRWSATHQQTEFNFRTVFPPPCFLTEDAKVNSQNADFFCIYIEVPIPYCSPTSVHLCQIKSSKTNEDIIFGSRVFI